jgi:CrcB protein
MEGLMELLWIGIAGGIGSIFRFFMSQWTGWLPWGILAANVVGSFIVGAYLVTNDPSQSIIVSALAGGISTFSSVSAQTWQFISLKLRVQAILNLLLNFVAPYLACMAGATLDLLIR